MQIESILRRKKGTNVKLGEKTYHFGPTKDEERHLCEVKNGKHIGTLLAITEGFRALDEESELDDLDSGLDVKKTEESVKKEPEPKLGDDNPDAKSDDPGKNDENKSTDGADDEGSENSEESTDKTDETENNTSGITPENSEGEVKEDTKDGSDEPPKELDRPELVKQFQAKFGNKPHGRWTAERIKSELDKED